MAAKKAFKSGRVLLGHVELTPKQQEFFKIMTSPNTKVVFLSGPAGVSKTWLSVYCALYLFNEDQKRKILYLRTVVESAQRSLGFLKGGLDEKFSEYLHPLEDKIIDLLNEQELDSLNKKNALEGAPINFVRGQDWKNKIIIADEMQNATLSELTLLVSRLNRDTKLFLCGDPFQSDIKNSGYSKLCNAIDDEEARENGIYHLEFTKEDIMRDPVVGFILDRIEGIS